MHIDLISFNYFFLLIYDLSSTFFTIMFLFFIFCFSIFYSTSRDNDNRVNFPANGGGDNGKNPNKKTLAGYSAAVEYLVNREFAMPEAEWKILLHDFFESVKKN